MPRNTVGILQIFSTRLGLLRHPAEGLSSLGSHLRDADPLLDFPVYPVQATLIDPLIVDIHFLDSIPLDDSSNTISDCY